MTVAMNAAGASQLAMLSLSPLWAAVRGRRGGSPAAAPSPAQRLQAGLQPLRISARDAIIAMAGMADSADLNAAIDRLEAKSRAGLTGRWHKDTDLCDSMDDAIEMVNLAWYLRPALSLLKTLEIEDTATHFKTILKAGGLMDVVECYPWDGSQVPHARRDKRKGQHMGAVSRREDGAACISVTWSEPYGGRCTDTFVVSEDGNTMTQYTDMTINSSGQHTEYKTVYKRMTT